MGGHIIPTEQSTASPDLDLVFASECIVRALDGYEVTEPKVGRDTFMIVTIIDGKAYKLWGQEVK